MPLQQMPGHHSRAFLRPHGRTMAVDCLAAQRPLSAWQHNGAIALTNISISTPTVSTPRPLSRHCVDTLTLPCTHTNSNMSPHTHTCGCHHTHHPALDSPAYGSAAHVVLDPFPHKVNLVAVLENAHNISGFSRGFPTLPLTKWFLSRNWI